MTRTTYLTGNTLYAACTPIIGEATGYVLGVVDTQAQAETQGLSSVVPVVYTARRYGESVSGRHLRVFEGPPLHETSERIANHCDCNSNGLSMSVMSSIIVQPPSSPRQSPIQKHFLLAPLVALPLTKI